MVVRRALVVAAVSSAVAFVVLLAWGGACSGPQPPEDSVLGGAKAPDGPPPPAPALAARQPSPASPAPGDGAREGRVVSVVVESEDPSVVEATVYAGPDAGRLRTLGKARCGVAAELGIGEADALLLAQPLGRTGRTHESMEDASAPIPAGPRPSMRLLLPRATTVLVVKAADGRGRPVPGVTLALQGAADPEAAQRTTDAGGEAVWSGVRSDLVGPSRVLVLQVPSDCVVTAGPTLDIRRAADGRAIGATGLVVLSRCNGSFRVRLEDTLATGVLLERRGPGGEWERANGSGYTALVDGSGKPIGRASPGGAPAGPDLLFAEGDSYAEGLYRLTVVGWREGIGEVEFGVRDGETAAVESLRAVPSALRPARLVGPAAGTTRALGVAVARAPEAALARWRDLSWRVEPNEVGDFLLVLPSGIEAVRFTDGPAERASVPVTPCEVAVPEAGRTVVVESRTARRLRGRLLDASGRPIVGASVTVLGRREGADGCTFPVGTAASGPDGSFTVGPAYPAAWRLVAKPSAGPSIERVIEVAEDTDAEVEIRAP